MLTGLEEVGSPGSAGCVVMAGSSNEGEKDGFAVAIEDIYLERLGV
jgi:hypothetical protein